MSLRYVALCAFLAGALILPAAPARADATADLRSFVGKTAALTFSDYAALHGPRLKEGEWKSPTVYGPSLSRCLVVDLPSMASFFFETPAPNEQPYSSAIQCDGAATKMTQRQLVAWSVKTISPLVPGRKMTQYPATKKNDRWSVSWKNATGQTLEFIAYGKSDAKRYPHVAFVIDVEQLSPETMATPTPAP